MPTSILTKRYAYIGIDLNGLVMRLVWKRDTAQRLEDSTQRNGFEVGSY